MRTLALAMLLSLAPFAAAGEESPALQALRAQAAGGDAAAQFEIGILYEFGFSQPDHKIPAHAWYSLAAEQGHARAATRRDLVQAQMSPAELEQARRLREELGARRPTPTTPSPPPPPQ